MQVLERNDFSILARRLLLSFCGAGVTSRSKTNPFGELVMKAIRKTAMAAAVAAMFGFGGFANATVIDLFNQPAGGTQIVTANNANPVVADQYAEPIANQTIIGGYRDLVASYTGPATSTPKSELYVEGGLLQFSNSNNVYGIGRVQWDGDDNADPGKLSFGLGANLINQTGCGAGCDRFTSAVLTADQGFVYQIGVYTDENNYSILTAKTQFQVSEAAFPGGITAQYLFSWFALAETTGTVTDLYNDPNPQCAPPDAVGPASYCIDGLRFLIESEGTVDFNNVGALELVLNSDGGQLSVDLGIDSIQKTVPEPGALALAAIALLGMSATTRRRASRQD
jgi:PEP-CTERM motif